MAQIDDLLAYVNANMPLRGVTWHPGNVPGGHDGDPNAAAAPAELKLAPIGTTYLNSAGELYTQLVQSAGNYILVGGDGARTRTALTIPVDYEDGTAVDPVAGSVFVTQDQIDNYLANNGASSFKHLQLIWDATPSLIAHNVIYACAGGTHRPTAVIPESFKAWALGGKTVVAPNTSIAIRGDSNTANWVVIEGTQTITSHDLSAGTPSITMSGASYTPDALKGRLAVLSTGHISPIAGNTATVIELCSGFVLDTPPVDSVDTVQVLNPNTKFANTMDDTTTAHSGSFWAAGVSFNDSIYLENMTFELWGGFSATITLGNMNANVTSVVLDADFVGAQGSGVGLFLKGPVSGMIDTYSVAANGNTGFYYPLETSWDSHGAVTTTIFNTYLSSGTADGGVLPLLGGSHILRFLNVIFDRCRIRGEDGIRLDFAIYAAIYGRYNTFRNFPGPLPALDFGVATSIGVIAGDPSQIVYFEGCVGPCVRLNSAASLGGVNRVGEQLDISFMNIPGGVANTDVGIEVSGSNNLLQLKGNTDVSGTVGDLRIEGYVGPYADLGTRLEPLVTSNNNVIGMG